MNEFSPQPLFGGYFVYTSAQHGFGTDSCLLAHFAAPKRKDFVCDLGSGCGILPLLFYARYSPAFSLGVEKNEQGAALLSEAVRAQRLEGRVQSLCADLRELSGEWTEYFDVVSCNPPYFSAGKKSPDAARRAARHEGEGCTLEQVCRSAHRLLKYGGRFCFCYPAERLVYAFSALGNAGLEPKRMRLVAKDENSPPRLALLEAKKGGKPGLKTLPALLLYDLSGAPRREGLEQTFSAPIP